VFAVARPIRLDHAAHTSQLTEARPRQPSLSCKVSGNTTSFLSHQCQLTKYFRHDWAWLEHYETGHRAAAVARQRSCRVVSLRLGLGLR
jgi:hypothetical protein